MSDPATGRLVLLLGEPISSRYLKRPGGGACFLNEVASRLGPGVLAQLRADDAFVALALHKAHCQNVYLFELNQASLVLDSLRSALR